MPKTKTCCYDPIGPCTNCGHPKNRHYDEHPHICMGAKGLDEKAKDIHQEFLRAFCGDCNCSGYSGILKSG